MDLELNVRSKTDQAAQTYQLPLASRVILGRGPESPVPLDGPSISRQHLVFEWQDGELYVTDLSSNGCWVNGQRIAAGEPFLVNEWEDIEIPGYAMNFIIRGAPYTPGRETRAATFSGHGTSTASAVATAPASVPEVTYRAMEQPEPAKANPVAAFLRSFTGFERFAILVGLISIALVLFYWLAYA